MRVLCSKSASGNIRGYLALEAKKIIFKENFFVLFKKFNSVCVSFDQLTALDLTAA